MAGEKKAIPIQALGAMLLWSTVATAFNRALQGMSPEWLLTISYSFSLLIFGLALFLTGQRRPSNLQEIAGYDSSYKASDRVSDKTRKLLFNLLSGFLNPYLYYLVLFKAYHSLPPAIAMSLNYSWPLFLALLLSLGGQRISLKDCLGLSAGFLGVALIALSGMNSSQLAISGAYLNGILLALASAIIWAASWVLSMKSSQNQLRTLFLNFLLALPFMLTLAPTLIRQGAPQGSSIFYALYVGAAEMGISFILWLKALTLSNRPSRVANLANFIPFLSLALIAFFTNETVTASKIAGLGLIILGNFLQRSKD